MISEDFIEIVIFEGAPVEEPGVELVPGENSVYVTVTNFFQDQTKVTFTAPVSATYTVSFADGETNGDLYDAFGNWVEVMPYTFYLEAGESLSFYVQSKDWEIAEDYIEIVIIGEEEQGGKTEPDALDGEYRVDFYGTTYYKLVFLGNVLTLTDDNAKLYSGVYTYEIDSNGGFTFYLDGVLTTNVLVETAPDGSYTFQCPSLKIPQALVKYEVPSEDPAQTVTKFSIGDNAIKVTNGWKGTMIPFTATENGVYMLAAAEKETNACIIIEDMYGAEILNLAEPYIFEIGVGEVKTFIVATQNSASDTINLVLTKVVE